MCTLLLRTCVIAGVTVGVAPELCGRTTIPFTWPKVRSSLYPLCVGTKVRTLRPWADGYRWKLVSTLSRCTFVKKVYARPSCC